MISLFAPFRQRPRRGLPPSLAGTLILAAAMASCSPTVLPSTSLWSADLAPTTPAGVTGMLGALSRSGSTEFSMQVNLGESGTTYLWRVSHGDCGTEGSLVAGKAVYPAMVASDGGSASADAVVAGELTSGEGYAARILRDSGGGEQVLACGVLHQTK